MPGSGGFEIDECVNNVVLSICWYTTRWKQNSTGRYQGLHQVPNRLARHHLDDKKEHHRCVECGYGTFSFPSRGSARTFTDNFSTQLVFKLRYLGGTEEHVHGHHCTG